MVLPVSLLPTLALSLSLACGSLVACGLGDLLLTGTTVEAGRRAVVARFLCGLFVYAALFGLAAQLTLGFAVAIALFGALGIVGLLRAAWLLGHQRCGRLPALELAVIVAVVAWLASLVPINTGATDPPNYAFGATTVFHTDWVTSHVHSELAFAQVDGLLREVSTARAPSFAVLWLPAAFGWPVMPEAVAGQAVAYLALAAVLLFDLLQGPLPLRAVIAVGALGLFNLEAALVGGQLGQTCAVAVSVSTMWLFRTLPTPRARLATALIAGYLLASSYPEFLLAAPLYVGCILLLCPSSRLAASAYGGALAAGFLLVQVTTRLGSVRYLLLQSGAVTQWWPLAAAPTNPADFWATVLTTGRILPFVLPFTLLIGWYIWRAPQPVAPARPFSLARPVLIGLATSAVVWTIVGLRGSNPNYATFKLGGWLGPGLFLVGWLLLTSVSLPARRVLATCLTVLALNRAVLLAGDARVLISLYRDTPSPTVDVATFGDAGLCLVHAPAQDVPGLARSIAVSAAAARGCDVVSTVTPPAG